MIPCHDGQCVTGGMIWKEKGAPFRWAIIFGSSNRIDPAAVVLPPCVRGRGPIIQHQRHRSTVGRIGRGSVPQVADKKTKTSAAANCTMISCAKLPSLFFF
jgi:hypothetical protein